jgi:uncharacterized protein YndB with AHSA1/START domain
MTNTEFVYTTFIKSTTQKVWNAITNAEFTKQYWGCELISDWTEGAKWHSVRNADGQTNMIGEVIESSPPNRLSYTWHLPDANEESDKSKISQGWPLVLSSLKSFLETGQALDIWAMKGSCSAQESAKEKVAR